MEHRPLLDNTYLKDHRETLLLIASMILPKALPLAIGKIYDGILFLETSYHQLQTLSPAISGIPESPAAQACMKIISNICQ